MPVSQRAKQFMPFAALPGLNEALAQKEQELIKQAKITLSPDMLNDLNQVLNSLHKNQQITVTYYADYAYQLLTGSVEEINTPEQFLKIGSQKINFADILKITLE